MYWLQEHNKLSESQAGFRFNCSCVDNLFCLNEVVQGRLISGTFIVLIKVVFILTVLNLNSLILLKALHRVVPISSIIPDFVDGLMKETESKVSSLQLNGLLFADDFVGSSDS